MAISPNIVLLEPDKAFGSELIDHLSNAGFDVILTNSCVKAQQALCAQQALAFLSETEFSQQKIIPMLDDLIELRKLPPVVMLLSSNPQFPIEQAFSRGVDAIFTKPFSMASLTDLLKSTTTPYLNSQMSRKSSRIYTDFPISLSKIGSVDESSSIQGTVMNLSQKGAFTEVHRGTPPSVGDIMEFEIRFPDAVTVCGLGRVTWLNLIFGGSQRFGFGLEFDSSSEEIGLIFEAVNRLKTFSRL